MQGNTTSSEASSGGCWSILLVRFMVSKLGGRTLRFGQLIRRSILWFELSLGKVKSAYNKEDHMVFPCAVNTPH